MASLSDFERYVLPFVANAPVPAIEDAVLDACIEFCTRTRLLRAMISVTTIPNSVEYELDPPEVDTQITDVAAVWLPEGEIHPFARPALDAHYPQGWATLKVGSTRNVAGFYCRLPGFIRLVPAVSVRARNAMTVEVVYAPSRSARHVDDVLFSRYAEVIATGALARLHQHPDASYADPARVGTYKQSFDESITRMGDDAQRGFSHRPLRTGRDDFI